MASEQTAAARRKRHAQEDVVRARQISIRLGALGLGLLFFAGIGILVYPDGILGLLGVMVAGFAFLLAGFLVILRATGPSLRLRDLTKLP